MPVLENRLRSVYALAVIILVAVAVVVRIGVMPLTGIDSITDRYHRVRRLNRGTARGNRRRASSRGAVLYVRRAGARTSARQGHIRSRSRSMHSSMVTPRHAEPGTGGRSSAVLWPVHAGFRRISAAMAAKGSLIIMPSSASTPLTDSPLVAKRLDGVDATGAPGGRGGGNDRREQDHDGHAAATQRIERIDAKEKCSDHPS